MWALEYHHPCFRKDVEPNEQSDAEVLLQTSRELAARRSNNNEVQVRVPVVLPPPEQVEEFIAALVERDGLTAVMSALIQAVPSGRAFKMALHLCAREFGVEPTIASTSGAEAYFWESDPSPRLLLENRPSQHDSAGPYSVYDHVRCWHCEPFRGCAEGKCLAMQALGSLADELKEQMQKVEEEEEHSNANGNGRRAARYFMYRKFVFAQYGYLGAGKRMRIPPCVIEFIRHQFREPGCNCPKGGALAQCTEHGYVGHRDVAQLSR
mmetsp:Transcript_1612/g.3813  ORF Transcript_1612/g.3813 Transcript_1612/m.3813 type:complete len:266 (-) Transcript_1612:104-901(-)